MVPESVFKFFGWFPFRTLSQILFLASPLVHSYTASCDGYIEQHTEKSTNDGRVKIHKLGDDRSSHIFFTMTKSKSSDDGANRPIIIYAKGNNWDLGSFHRRPYMVSPSNPVASKVNTSLAEIMVNSTGGTVFCFEYPGHGTWPEPPFRAKNGLPLPNPTSSTSCVVTMVLRWEPPHRVCFFRQRYEARDP